MAALRGLRQMLCVLPLLALVACKGIEKGDKIDHMLLVNVVPTASGGTQVVALPTGGTVQAYQCLRQQLGVYAVFSKNGTGDYTSREGTIWTSDRPDIVSVSNGDELDPVHPDRVFPKGVITALSGGTAIITANYIGIQASIQVTVTAPDSIILSTSEYDTSADASKAPPFSMATGSTQQYFAYAKLRDQNGVTSYQNITGNAVWSVLGASSSDYATVSNAVVGTTSGAGLVTGKTPATGLTLNANFPACPNSQYVNITTQFNVSGVQSLTVQHNPNFLAITNPGFVFTAPPAAPAVPPNPPNPLVTGTREAFVVTAKLNNGDYQDLSLQSTLDTRFCSGSVLTFSGAGNIATATTTPGNTCVTASFTGGGNTVLSSTSSATALPVQTQAATMSNYVIAPADRNQKIPLQGFRTIHSQATFIPDVPPGSPQTPFIQDLSYDTAWVTNSPTDVLIGNSGDLVGVAVSLRSVETCVEVTGIYANDATLNTFYKTGLGVGIGVSATGCPTH